MIKLLRGDTKLTKRFMRKVRVGFSSGCWEWIGRRDKLGYGDMRVNYSRVRAHRLSYEWYYGSFPQDLLVCHKCDNPSCVNPHHLFLGTNSDNMRDMAMKGRGGKYHPPRKSLISDERIYYLYSNGLSQRQIAEMAGVSQMAVSKRLRVVGECKP